MSLTCLKEAQTIQDEFFTHAMEVLKFNYDDYRYKDCHIIMANFSYDMADYSPREDLDPSIWKSWLDNCLTFVYGLAVGKGTYENIGFSFEELEEILRREAGGSSLAKLTLSGDDLVSDQVLCDACCECACGQCSPCSCSSTS